ncbi:hypothetical protein JIR001_07410 [Polycladomyces abyssicola]|jgi:hypothetical protein|uniref:Uncharacterized protein n=1 Tax=Polycladomyces abyssicola TaxID=1125966 RepID=A0A8D5ZN43_9BACL|nr:hypothetical protein [Polycladomyces abyssicola]BCU80958.1 hypothetical protein JIR001_07410 [Polycladomyces abyssicola]
MQIVKDDLANHTAEELKDMLSDLKEAMMKATEEELPALEEKYDLVVELYYEKVIEQAASKLYQRGA